MVVYLEVSPNQGSSPLLFWISRNPNVVACGSCESTPPRKLIVPKGDSPIESEGPRIVCRLEWFLQRIIVPTDFNVTGHVDLVWINGHKIANQRILGSSQTRQNVLLMALLEAPIGEFTYISSCEQKELNKF